MDTLHNQHIYTTIVAARHEYLHALYQKDYIQCLQWSMLWMDCWKSMWNRASDFMINSEMIL